MITHHVKVSPSKVALPKSGQLAWKIAETASDKTTIDSAAGEMVVNRIIDNAAVAIAAINREPVANARTQALAHPREAGAKIFGLSSQRFDCEWAAWANGVAVRELDMHDTFLAADYSHPGDNIPPLLAVAQQCGRSGADLLRGILVAYEIQMNLVRAICLHEFKKDHIAHLCPSAAAGIGAMLNLETEIIFQAVQQAVHVGFSTRQSRKGEISSWKAYAPAHASKLAIEAVDRAMRGEKSPSPIYEGEDSVIAWMLGGKNASYDVPLPAPGEPCRAILDSYTKEHSAEYQAQAWIDLAFKLRKEISDLKKIQEIIIHTSHHTHFVIGTGANDPQKSDPNASRETLDHSIMFIFASALHTGFWHHVKSYAPEVAQHPEVVALWKKITTREDAEWTRRYHSIDPKEKAFGGRVEIIFNDDHNPDSIAPLEAPSKKVGVEHVIIPLKSERKLIAEIAVADAHPLGARPFARANYIHKFKTLTEDLISPDESKRFLDLIATFTAAFGNGNSWDQCGVAVRRINLRHARPTRDFLTFAGETQREYFLAMSLNQIKDAVAELPDKARGSLAAWLLDSLPPHAAEDDSDAGVEEASRRRDELGAGKADLISANEFWAAVKQERASWK